MSNRQGGVLRFLCRKVGVCSTDPIANTNNILIENNSWELFQILPNTLPCEDDKISQVFRTKKRKIKSLPYLEIIPSAALEKKY